MFRKLLQHAVWRAFSLALANTGNKMAANTAMIAMTTSNSMSVKPRRMVALTLLVFAVDVHRPNPTRRHLIVLSSSFRFSRPSMRVLRL